MAKSNTKRKGRANKLKAWKNKQYAKLQGTYLNRYLYNDAFKNHKPQAK